MKSERTKQCKRLSLFFLIMHFLCLFGPFLYFFPYAVVTAVPGQKIVLSLFFITAATFSAIAVFSEARTRGGLVKSIMWLLIFGITLCLETAKVFIGIMAIISIIDELFIVRMRAKYKDAFAANREIDRRK